MGTFIDLSEQRFGRLVVIERAPNNAEAQARWKCKCDCGNEVIVSSGHLRSGHSKSCGCLARERSSKYHLTHGMKGTRIFSVYNGMKGRCYNPNDRKYPRYGGRGISMCEEWRNNPSSFFDWAFSNGYRDGLSIDRIDNNGNYSPENCRWADDITQANNKSTNHIYEHNGEKKTIAEWSRELGLSYSATNYRIKRGSFDELFGNMDANHHFVSHNGVTMSIDEWALFLNAPYSTIRARVRRGSFERLFPKDKEELLNTWTKEE